MRKKKLKPFRSTKAVKSLARDVVGMPPPARVVPDKKKNAKGRPKHKPTLEQMLKDEQ